MYLRGIDRYDVRVRQFPPIAVIAEVAKEVVSFAKDLKELFGGDPNKGISDKLDTVITKIDHVSEHLNQIDKKLDAIKSAVDGLYSKIDKTVRDKLFANASTVIQNLPIWVRDSHEPETTLELYLQQLQAAREEVIHNGSLESVDALAYAMAAEFAMYALLLRRTKRSSFLERSRLSSHIYSDHFALCDHNFRLLLDQANATQTNSNSRLAQLSIGVDRSGGSIAPPGPYIPVGQVGRCILIQRCNGSLETGFSVLTQGGNREGLTWTRDTIHYPPFFGEGNRCHNGDHNEVQNNYPLTSLAELNGLSDAYQAASSDIIARNASLETCKVYLELAATSHKDA